MDLSGGLRRFCALFDRPRAALVFAVGQEGDQPQQLIRTLDQAIKAGLLNPQIGQKHCPLLRIIQLGDVLLKLGADGQHLRALLLCQLTDALKICIVRIVGKARLVHVGSIDDRLQAQQIRRLDDGALLIVARKGARRLAGIQMRGERLEHLGLAQELLVALGGLGRLLDAAVDHLQIGHDELQIDRADVAQRVDRLVLAGVGHHVHDVLIIKTAHHVDDGIGAADVFEELIAQTRALAGALDQTCNVDKLDHRGGLFLWLIHLSQIIQPRIRHGDHADVRVDGAERIVGDFRARVRNGVEQRGLADVRQADDT